MAYKKITMEHDKKIALVAYNNKEQGMAKLTGFPEELFRSGRQPD